MRGNNRQHKSSCMICDAQDNDEMVACDACNKWFHHNCVGVVEETVRDESWSCEKCIHRAAQVHLAIGQTGDEELPVEQFAVQELAARELERKKQMMKDRLYAQYLADVEKTIADGFDPRASGSKAKSVTSSKSAASKASSKQRRMLELERLEEEKKLNDQIAAARKQRVEEETKRLIQIQQENARALEKLHLEESAKREQVEEEQAKKAAENIAQRYELLRDQAASDDESMDEPLCDGPDVDKWLQQSKFVHHSTIHEKKNVRPIEPRFEPRLAEPRSNIQPNELRQPNAPQPPIYGHATGNTRLPPPTGPQSSYYANHQQQQRQTANNHNESRQFIPDYWPQPQPNNAANAQAPPPAEQDRYNTYLHPRQLATRQVLSKDLPTFSGKPEEWAIFITNYEHSTQICGYSNHENLLRLQRALKGSALRSVESRLLLPSNVPMVIETLRMLFGDPELIVDSILNTIRGYPPIKAEKMDSLMDFALSVQGLCSTIESTGLFDELKNTTLMRELVAKLPMNIRLNWGMYIESSQPIGGTQPYGAFRPDLTMLAKWLCHVARSARRVTPTIYAQPTASPSTQKKERPLNSHMIAESSDKPQPNISRAVSKASCCACKSTEHKTENCSTFKSLTLDDKWALVHKLHLCRKCLDPHNSYKCASRRLCGINECTYKHHPLLHNPESRKASVVEIVNNIHRSKGSKLLFRIIPVTLHGQKARVHTYAFLDEGSSLTLVEEDVADELGISGTMEPLCLKWTADHQRTEDDSRRISVQISAQHPEAKLYEISSVRTVKSLNLPRQSISGDMLAQHAHLHGLPIATYEDAVPRILIGLDQWKLGIPQATKEGSWKEPAATKTRLGWVVHGHHRNEEAGSSANVHFLNLHECGCHRNDELIHEQVKAFFSLESFGVKVPERALVSKEEARAKLLLATRTQRDERGFTTGLLWRYDDVRLPESYAMAKRRLICLEKKMEKDKSLATNLRKQMGEYLIKGYIREVSQDEINLKHSRTWYLPVFAVTNPNKPGKVRMVWDAAAKVDGISLNSVLLKGPDELTSLPGVLQRFRQKQVAICGDIQEMFHQVRMREEDQQSQRFLWRDGDSSATPRTYKMQVMTFGATCSPSAAQYVKNVNAAEYRKEFPRAYTAIVENHYVDDMLDSVDTTEEAIQLVKDVIHIHRKGGFHIRNWISNSPELLQAIGVDNADNSKNLQMSDEEAPAKVLGMWWRTESDCFTFSMSLNRSGKEILQGTKRPTKREVLRTLMSIYDPLGFLASFLLPVKILLQEIWRSAIGWDDEIRNEHFEIWKNWLRILPTVEEIRVPRCYFTSSPVPINNIQLHVFVDASEKAYSAVAFFRTTRVSEVDCAIVSAKTRVAPVQPLSIPRMELQAAVLGARLANSILKHHRIKIDETVLWSDSRNVLSWIKSDARSYKQFVAFRVGELLETTNINQWRWIPTKLNVADEATKWQPAYDFSPQSRWFTGPTFLKMPREQWPQDTSKNIEIETDEIRPCLLHQECAIINGIDADRFSKWKRLVRTQAFVYRYVHNLKAKSNKKERETNDILPSEYELAEMHLFRQAQWQCFGDEVAICHTNRQKPLTERRTIQKSSALYTISPYMDEKNVLRMRGRIDAANVPLDTKRPIVLPRGHRITHLIVDDCHRRYHHQNHETVVNELCQRFWIQGVRGMVKRVRSACQECKIRRAKPNAPEMANLPAGRLAAYSAPFSHTGVDYFGPLLVTIGRRTEKRWGALFTCLTIRAVHLELAHSLSTDSFILCFKNFTARRGTPIEMYSDNGTNFVGAENELKDELKKMKMNEVVSKTYPKIRWNFNPPASPHMGGAWERLVRSTKTSLYAIMPTLRTPNEELLRSLLIEVENVVNSRPLTHVPINGTDEEALTPNHFLVGSSSGAKQWGMFNGDPMMLRKNWMRTEQLAEHFWRRWVKEYLPTLTRRTKWTTPTKPIQIGDVVIIVDPNSVRNTWPKGIVLDTIVAKDGQVRQATVQTCTGIYTRPAIKLAVLDVQGK